MRRILLVLVFLSLSLSPCGVKDRADQINERLTAPLELF